MKTIGIGLLGLGTVGSGVVKALEMNNKSIEAKLTTAIEIKRILVRDLQKPRAVQVNKQLLTTDFHRVVEDPEIGIIVDVMGGIEPAREYILAAIERGKHVVTANKEVIAKYGREILAAAQAQGVGVYFEASVGGGIPIIRPLKHCLQANQIEEIMGIINGTTNYILTKMATEGRDFGAILKEAQEKGYAEPDPTNDVEGYDAAYKLAILTSLAFGTPAGLRDIPFQGITSITRDDMAWAGTLGYTVKLLAVAKDRGDGLEARVAPCLLPREHPLAKVNDVFNGIYVKGNLVGELLLTGRGAGDLPTASAVVADIMDIARVARNGNTVEDACTCYRYKPFLPAERLSAAYYVRVKVARTDAVIPVNNLLTQEHIPCEVALKKMQQGRGGTVIYFTGLVKERDIETAAQKLRGLNGVKEVSVLRLEGCQDAQALNAGANPG